jgi:hypothetical protein
MSETFSSIVKWLVVALALSPAWATLVWHLWVLAIKPRLIPRERIIRMADELRTEFGEEAEDIAFIYEDRAWRRSETLEQGIWHRVRLELYRRREISRKTSVSRQ